MGRGSWHRECRVGSKGVRQCCEVGLSFHRQCEGLYLCEFETAAVRGTSQDNDKCRAGDKEAEIRRVGWA